jgi:hypothetical protein
MGQEFRQVSDRTIFKPTQQHVIKLDGALGTLPIGLAFLPLFHDNGAP